MKEMKKIVLHYQDKRSDKIYEVILCESKEDNYLVNFRYGRRDSVMKEGSKTILPVSLERAERMFEALVTSKTKKGYKVLKESDAPVNFSKSAEAGEMGFDDLSRLRRLIKSPHDRTLDRVIWRLAEKGEQAAKDDLLALYGSHDDLRDYIVSRALGRCAVKGDINCLQVLSKIYKSNKVNDMCRRAALEASLILADEAEKLLILEYVKSKIPDKIGSLLKLNSDEADSELFELLKEKKGSEGEPLYYCYLLDYVEQSGRVVKFLEKIPWKAGYFRRIRHIFKAAEYFNDAALFGLLSYRLEKSRPGYDSGYYYTYLRGEGRMQYFTRSEKEKELKKGDSRLAYGAWTRDYLRRRVWRHLNSLALRNDKSYVKSAVEYLKHFEDRDGGNVSSSYSYDYSLSRWKTVYYDKYSLYFIFNHILYENSNRYDMHAMRMRCINDYKPGDLPPAEREEAYPALWDEQCLELKPLLMESRCERVHHFALGVLKDNLESLKFSKNELFSLMAVPYVETAKFTLEHFKSRFSGHRFSVDEVSKLFAANCLEVREFVCSFLRANESLLVNSVELLYQGAVSVYEDLQLFVKEFLLKKKINEQILTALFSHLSAFLITEKGVNKSLVESVVKLITETMQSVYRKVSVKVVCDFIASNEESLQFLGASMALESDNFRLSCPSEIINSLLDSKYSSIQGIGVTLFARKSDSELLGEMDMLLKFVVNSAADVREAVAPVLSRLAYSSESFANELIPLLIFKLRKSSNEEVQHFIVTLFKEQLAGIKELSLKIIMKLIRSRSTIVQELGGHFLSNSKHRGELGLDELNELYNCDTLAVRELGWQESEKRLELLKAEVGKTVRLLDAEWDDSRNFAFTLIREHFKEDDFTAAALVSICDSVRDDVSSFGREIIGRYFHGEHSVDYLLKLSEHPSVNMQVFVTDYLEQYAGGDVERVRRMVPYFQSLLCRVNKASRAKKRVVSFLERESLASAETADLIAPILTFVSATASRQDKATYLELMVKIRRQYPQIELPVEIQEIGVENAI